MDPIEVVQHTGDAAFATDERGRIVIWNRAAERLLGFAAGDVLGRRCHEVLKGIDVFGNLYCRGHCNLAEMARNREVVHGFELVVRTAGGRTARVRCSVLVAFGRRPGEFTLIHILQPPAARVAERADPPSAWVPSARQPSPDRRRPVPREPLTPREHQVLARMVEGASTKEIAASMVISVATVRTHVQNILRKLEARNRLEAVTIALRERLLRGARGGHHRAARTPPPKWGGGRAFAVGKPSIRRIVRRRRVGEIGAARRSHARSLPLPAGDSRRGPGVDGARPARGPGDPRLREAVRHELPDLPRRVPQAQRIRPGLPAPRVPVAGGNRVPGRAARRGARRRGLQARLPRCGLARRDSRVGARRRDRRVPRGGRRRGGGGRRGRGPGARPDAPLGGRAGGRLAAGRPRGGLRRGGVREGGRGRRRAAGRGHRPPRPAVHAAPRQSAPQREDRGVPAGDGRHLRPRAPAHRGELRLDVRRPGRASGRRGGRRGRPPRRRRHRAPRGGGGRRVLRGRRAPPLVERRGDQRHRARGAHLRREPRQGRVRPRRVEGGGLAPDGSNAADFAGSPKNWRERSVQVGVFGYVGNGRDALLGSGGGHHEEGGESEAAAAAAVEDERFSRLGADLNAVLGDFNLTGGFVRGTDVLNVFEADPDDPDALGSRDAETSGTFAYSAWFAELDAVLGYAWLHSALRYEAADLPAGGGAVDWQRATVHLTALVRANVKAFAEWSVNPADTEESSVWLGCAVGL